MLQKKKYLKSTAQNRKSEGIVVKAQNGFASMRQGLHDALYGKPLTLSPGKMADINRSSGEKISDVLRIVDWSALQRKESVSSEELKEFKEGVNALAVSFEKAATINDDISELDIILYYIAQTLRTAAENGRSKQVQWCINALCTGVLEYRSDVPHERADHREEIIAAEVEYMKNYVNIVETYELLEINERSIAEDEKDIEEKESLLEEQMKKLKEIDSSVEGKKTFAKIKLNQDLLSTEEWIGELVDDATSNKQALFRVKADRSTLVKSNSALNDQVQTFKNALRNRPMPNQYKLVAEAELALQHFNETLEKRLDIASEMKRIRDEQHAQLEAILRGKAAQDLAQGRAEGLENLQNPTDENESAIMKQVIIDQDRKKEAYAKKAENERKLKKILDSIQTSENEQVDSLEIEIFDTDDQIDYDMETEEDRQYNLNG